jgi:hypothetical protein
MPKSTEKFESKSLNSPEEVRKFDKGIQTAEPDRRDQVTATGPGPVPFERGQQRSIIR